MRRAGTSARNFPEEALRKAAALGFAGIYVGEKFGGSGLTRLDATIIFEELATACVSTAAYLSIHNMAAWMIDRFGDEATARPLSAEADVDGAFRQLLPDRAGQRLRRRGACRPAPGATAIDYVLNGVEGVHLGRRPQRYLCRRWCAPASPARAASPAWSSRTARRACRFGKQEKKLGWNTQPTAAVIFENCRVPVANRLGAEGEGFSIAMMGLDGGRLNIGACSLGGARACWEAARAYMLERRQFGQRLADFQALQFKLADMATELDAARLMLRRAASSLDKGDPDATLHCAMAKRLATDAGFRIANEALQLHGGYGYLKDFPIERYLRDVRVAPDPRRHQRDHARHHRPPPVAPVKPRGCDSRRADRDAPAECSGSGDVSVDIGARLCTLKHAHLPRLPASPSSSVQNSCKSDERPVIGLSQVWWRLYQQFRGILITGMDSAGGFQLAGGGHRSFNKVSMQFKFDPNHHTFTS